VNRNPLCTLCGDCVECPCTHEMTSLTTSQIEKAVADAERLRQFVDVMQRRQWYAILTPHGNEKDGHWIAVDGMLAAVVQDATQRYSWADPIEAILAADKWLREQEGK
jgi:hypothetical protein